MSTGTIVAGFIVSTVGFSVFLFGKRQARVPQLAGGILLMVIPLVIADPLWMACAAALATGGTWIAVRSGF